MWMNVCVCVFISVYREENIDYILLAYCTWDSLDIFNLILTVLRPALTGVLFDLILKFRAALTLSLLPPLLYDSFFFGLSSYYQCSLCVHFSTNVCECKLVRDYVSICVCVQLDDWPRSLNIKTWMKDWKAPWSPLEAPSASADTLQGPRSWGREIKTGETRPRGRREAKDPGSIYSPRKYLWSLQNF